MRKAEFAMRQAALPHAGSVVPKYRDIPIGRIVVDAGDQQCQGIAKQLFIVARFRIDVSDLPRFVVFLQGFHVLE
jgi:hypothetical protein